jgi:cytidylate kinase
VYAGQIFRQEAAARGLSLEQMNELASHEESVDRGLDERQLEFLRRGNVILEGRMAGWLAATNEIPAFKVWLVCEEAEAIRRLVDRDGGDFSEQLRYTRQRIAREADRYKRYYGADPTDPAIYDLVLDSAGVEPPELVGRVLEGLKRYS